MRIKRTGRVAITLVMALLLTLVVGCAPAPGDTPPLTPAPDEVTTSPSTEEGAPPPAGEIVPPPTSETAPSPVPEANFRLLISDDVNAIGDFESLMVTISSVEVHKAGEVGEWFELSPATEELDLVSLQGDNAQEIWSGDLPDGEYTKVFAYVSAVNGILNGGVPAEVKLPSEKLHINTHFSIPEDSPVNFVFDISVVATGSGQNGVKYILKPVVSQSGPNQNFTEVNPPEGETERERERERLGLELEGNIAIGELVTLLVTFEGEPVALAEVVVNGEEIGNTTDDGTISFTIPEDADELEIEVKLGELEGELELEFSEAE